jgi:hypothetical protein
MTDNITIKDGSGASVTVHSKDDGTGKQTMQSVPSGSDGSIAWGTAGSANANVMTVQGIASGTPVPVKTNAAGDVAAKLTDGTNTAAVKAANTAPVAADPALVVAISPNSTNANGSAASANSAPVVIANDQKTLAVAQDVTLIADGNAGTTITISAAGNRAALTASSSGATTMVAATASKTIRVLALYLSANGAVNLNLQSHTTTSQKTGLTYCAAAGDGIVLPFNPCGWFDTVAGEALDINLSAAVAVDGYCLYVKI